MSELQLLRKLNAKCNQELSKEYLKFDDAQSLKRMFIKIQKETGQFIQKAKAAYSNSDKVRQLNNQFKKCTIEVQKLNRQLQEYKQREKPPEGWMKWTLMALPRLIRYCFNLLCGILKKMVYLLSIGYLDLFQEDEQKIKQRQIVKKKQNIEGIRNQIIQQISCRRIIKQELRKFVEEKVLEYDRFIKEIQKIKK